MTSTSSPDQGTRRQPYTRSSIKNVETSKGQLSGAFLESPKKHNRSESDLHRAIVFQSSARRGRKVTPYQTGLTGAAGCRRTETNSLDLVCRYNRDPTGIRYRERSSTEVKRVLLVGVGPSDLEDTQPAVRLDSHSREDAWTERRGAAHECRNVFFCILLTSCPSDLTVEPQFSAPITLHCL